MDGFFEGELTVWKLKIPKRLLIPLLIVILAKVAAGLFVYFRLNIQSTGTFWVGVNEVPGLQNQVFLSGTLRTERWLDLFLGWDSGWYLSILTKGYAFSSQSYSFFPGFPVFGRTFTVFLSDPAVSMVLCSLIFGVLWIPIYQLVAEFYVSKKAALASALFFALSPYIFLFTTVAYSEGLLLFFVLITWYLFKKGKIALASATAAVATVTRVVGILIIIPMLIEVLKHGKQHKLRNALLCCLPIAAFFGWLAYGQVTANDWLALIHTTEWHGLYTVHGFFTEILPLKGIQAFSELPYPQWLSTLAIWGTIIITPILVVKAFKIDKPLAVYSLAYYVGAIVFGALISMPRFLSILFPLWLTVTAEMSHVGKKSMVCFIAVLAVFFIISVDLWINFLNGKFIA